MKSFYGGQIREEARGRLAVVIQFLQEEWRYDAVSCPVHSEPFVEMTGTNCIHRPIERVYIGVNRKTAESVKAQVRKYSPPHDPKEKQETLELLLTSLDQQIAQPAFLF